jgi:hypothetical protein
MPQANFGPANDPDFAAIYAQSGGASPVPASDVATRGLLAKLQALGIDVSTLGSMTNEQLKDLARQLLAMADLTAVTPEAPPIPLAPPAPGVSTGEGDFARNLAPAPVAGSTGAATRGGTQQNPDGTFPMPHPDRLAGIIEDITPQMAGSTPDEVYQRALEHLTMEIGATGMTYAQAKDAALSYAQPGSTAIAPAPVAAAPQYIDYSAAIAKNQQYIANLSAVQSPTPAQQSSLAAAQVKVADYGTRQDVAPAVAPVAAAPVDYSAAIDKLNQYIANLQGVANPTSAQQTALATYKVRLADYSSR